jgi:hypothetical protein
MDEGIALKDEAGIDSIPSSSAHESPVAVSMAPTSTGSAPREEAGFYDAYAGFARNLRTWLIAYGIGGPVLFVSQSFVTEALVKSGTARGVAYAFLGGVVLQIVAALIYKSAMWYCYQGELEPGFRESRRFRVSGFISCAYWLEFSFDLITIALFAWATWRVLSVITGTTG